MPFSSRSLSASCGAELSTNSASQFGRGPSKCSITHCRNGSATTAPQSSTPSARATASRSAGVVAGTTRSTIEHGNRWPPPPTSRSSTSPLRGRLSSDITVSGVSRSASAVAQQRDHRRVVRVGLLGHGHRDDVGVRDRRDHPVALGRRVQHVAHALDHAELVGLPAGDERVGPVLGVELVDDVTPARRDADDPPVAGVLRVLPQMGARERAQPEVDDAHGERLRGPGEPFHA